MPHPATQPSPQDRSLRFLADIVAATESASKALGALEFSIKNLQISGKEAAVAVAILRDCLADRVEDDDEPPAHA